MSFDAFDDWDATFLDQAAQLEEAAISARNATQSTSSFSIPLPSVANVSFSPPRELSQRFPDPSQSDPLPHKEVDRLKVRAFFPSFLLSFFWLLLLLLLLLYNSFEINWDMGGSIWMSWDRLMGVGNEELELEVWEMGIERRANETFDYVGR